jgi:hypothetical protein
VQGGVNCTEMCSCITWLVWVMWGRDAFRSRKHSGTALE